MNEKRKAIRCGALALAILFGGCLLSLGVPRFQVFIVAASFAGYVACTRRALALCRANDLVFEPNGSEARENEAREAVRAGLLAGSAGALSLGRSVNASPRVRRQAWPERERRDFPRPLDPLTGTR